MIKVKRKKKNSRAKIFWVLIGTVAVGGSICAGIVYQKQVSWSTPEELLTAYMAYIPEGEYEKMYEMLNIEASGNIAQEEFIKRNSAIYEGIEMRDMDVEIIKYEKEKNRVTYHTSFDTVAGTISFENEAVFLEGKKGYELVWEDSLIFPELQGTDKVRVTKTEAKRGQILDRNGRVLAGPGVASSVGIVPGKLGESEEVYQQVVELLEINPEVIKKKLSANWVKDDSFVPIKIIPKIKEIELLSASPDEKVLKEKERQDKLLEISGVMISDIEVREYPLGEASAHLTGYVQSVTAEDLEEHAGEGYTANSVIGKSGVEGLFEKELKGQNGCKIYIADGDGNEKTVLANQPVSNGQDVQLTIDANLQTIIYTKFQGDKSCTAAMDPYTGEVLALVSTPSFDSNDFIRGMSDEQWTALNESEAKPMYNRFRQVWCPGSTFKPITAAVGLESGAINPTEDYGNVGLSWQKDSS